MPSYECPTCQKPFKVDRREDAPHRPFCSQRCRLLDLHKWFAGEYKISDPLPPAFPDPDDSGDLPVPAEDDDV